MNDQIRRLQATQQTKDKYWGKPFDWKGGQTCIHMARFHAVKMGHKPLKMPTIQSAIGARRALKDNGWVGVSEMLDSMFLSIAPASMKLGDLAVIEGDQGFDAIVVNVGHKVIGWHENGSGMVAMTPIGAVKAWHV